MIKNAFKKYALRTGKLKFLYMRWCKPNSVEHANYLRAHGGFHFIGDNVRINIAANFTDPPYVSIGNNVVLSGCTLIGHDGLVEVLYQMYGESVDAVGKIVVHDNVFIGHGAIILRDVSIGPNAIVAAGAVVSRDVPPGEVVAGIPARKIGLVKDHFDKLRLETGTLPWGSIIKSRKGGFDSELEAELLEKRIKAFFPSGSAD